MPFARSSGLSAQAAPTPSTCMASSPTIWTGSASYPPRKRSPNRQPRNLMYGPRQSPCGTAYAPPYRREAAMAYQKKQLDITTLDPMDADSRLGDWKFVTLASGEVR